MFPSVSIRSTFAIAPLLIAVTCGSSAWAQYHGRIHDYYYDHDFGHQWSGDHFSYEHDCDHYFPQQFGGHYGMSHGFFNEFEYSLPSLPPRTFDQRRGHIATPQLPFGRSFGQFFDSPHLRPESGLADHDHGSHDHNAWGQNQGSGSRNEHEHRGHDHDGHSHGHEQPARQATPLSPPPLPDVFDVRPVEPDGDRSIPRGFSRLSATDRAVALIQGTCPVTGDNLGEHGTPIKVRVRGRDVFVCCEGCVEELRNNPERYLRKLGDKTASRLRR